MARLKLGSPVDQANQVGDTRSRSAHMFADDSRKRTDWQKQFKPSQWRGDAANTKYPSSLALTAGRSYPRGRRGPMQLRR
jgi:hypothetical protein